MWGIYCCEGGRKRAGPRLAEPYRSTGESQTCGVLLESISGWQEVVGDRVIVLVQSVGLVAFEARDLSCIEEVGVAPVGDYLSSNTCLLRVTSSLPAVVDSQQPTPGVYYCAS